MFDSHKVRPDLIVRHLICRAIGHTFNECDLQRAVADLRLMYSKADAAVAWAQLVRVDAWRLQRMWPNPVPYHACLTVANVIMQAFGPPPRIEVIAEASGLTEKQFIQALSRGRASLFSVNPLLVDAGSNLKLIQTIAEKAFRHKYHAGRLMQISAIGQMYRIFCVSLRRIRGISVNVPQEKIALESIDDDFLPLQLLQMLLRVCHTEANAAGLSVLLVCTTPPSAWMNVFVTQPWSVHGASSFTIDALALWANVTRRLAPSLEPWANETCTLLVNRSNMTNAEVDRRLLMGELEFIREYDPETDRYLGCFSGSSADSAWIAADKTPAALKDSFSKRRAMMRGNDTGRTIALMWTLALDLGAEFVVRLSTVLDNHLRSVVPGDLGLRETSTIRAIGEIVCQQSRSSLPWRSLMQIPLLLHVAILNNPASSPGQVSTILEVLKESFRSPRSGKRLYDLATACADDNGSHFKKKFFLEWSFLNPKLSYINKCGALQYVLPLLTGTKPDWNKYSPTMAAVFAFAVSTVNVSCLLKATVKHHHDDAIAVIFTVVAGFYRNQIPSELQTIVMRHWIIASALQF